MRIVIVGAGKVGFNIADHLSREQLDVVIIERNAKRLRTIASELDVQVIRGSGSSPRALSQAQVAKADMIIAVTDSDEVNLTACMIANAYAPNIIKIARIRDPEIAAIAQHPDQFGIKLDLAINPEAVAADKILRHIDIPMATEVVSFADGRVHLIGVRITQDSPVIGRTLAEIRARHPEFLVAALSRASGAIIPKGEDRIQADDVVYIVSNPSDITDTLSFFGKSMSPVRSIIVYGGTIVGQLVAQAAEKRGISTKIIDSQRAICDTLAEQLDRTIVLQGDGTDEELLREEHIADTGSFIAVSDDEESNLISAILAKNLGSHSVITLTDNPAYIPMAPRVGIDITISPRLIAVSSILHFVRRGQVLSVTAFSETDAEALEFIAQETAEVVGKPLRDIRFPSGAMIGAVVRHGETLVPSGTTIIQPGDRVIVFALKSAVHKVENVLMVKLKYS